MNAPPRTAVPDFYILITPRIRRGGRLLSFTPPLEIMRSTSLWVWAFEARRAMPVSPADNPAPEDKPKHSPALPQERQRESFRNWG